MIRLTASHVLCALMGLASPVFAQSAENVAVVINDASPASQRVGDYYVKKRGIPADNVIHIRTATSDELPRAAYLASIESPIAAAIGQRSLQDRVLFIVLTKGIPLRVSGTGGPQGTVASVDSELTLLYRRLTGKAVATVGYVENPYFLGSKEVRQAAPFSHADYDIFLVTRLDAFTVEEAIGLIDKAAAPVATGTIVLDQKLTLPLNRNGENWLEDAARRLRDAGQEDRVMLDTTTRGVRDVPQVLGYYSWGSNDPANQARRFGMGFVPGSLAATFVSTDLRTLQEPPADWVPSGNWTDPAKSFAGSPQSLVGDLIREGATGAAGQVAEPYLASTIRPQILFPSYLAGFTLAEAYYLAMPHLSWQTVVIGDPLCRPFRGRTLTRGEIEAPVDPVTEFPGYFSKRRLDATRAVLGEANAAAAALMLRAEMRSAKNDLPGATAALEQAATLSPTVPGLQLQVGLLYEQAGKRDAAFERYRRVLALQPNNVLALNNLAYGLAVYKSSPAEAEPLAKRAAGLAPNEPTILDTYGWVEHLLGNDEDAAKILTAALAKGAASGEVHLHAAIVFAARSAWAAAASALDEAVRLDPSIDKRDEVRHLRDQIARGRAAKG